MPAVSGEIGQEWEARQASGKSTEDLKALVEEIVPFNMKNSGEPDACDLLMEVDLLPSVVEHVTETNFSRICLYLTVSSRPASAISMPLVTHS